MTSVDEIAPDVFRISTYVPAINLQFNQFLVRDDEPLLFHTGLRGMFEATREGVRRVLDPASVQWLGFSHFEADECGSLAQWQELAPRSEAICTMVGKLVSVDDSAALRPARALADEEVLETGRHRFRFLVTPQVPHAWDAGLLLEETTGTLFCSDLFHHEGEVEAVTDRDVLDRVRHTMTRYEQGPMTGYLVWSRRTRPTLERLAALKPRVVATMHGSAYAGDGAGALRGLSAMMQEILE